MTLKFAFHSGSYHDIPITTAVKKVKQAGYDAIELNAEMLPWIDGQPHIRPNMDKEEVNDLQKCLQENDLDVSALSAHIGLIHTSPQKRKEAIDFSKSCILIAKQLGTTVVHGLSGEKPDSMSEEEAWSNLVDAVEEIISFAQKEGVKFAFEPVVGMFVNSGKKLKILRERVSTGKLYVNFDPSHLILVNENIGELVHHFNRDIVHVHFKDARNIGDSFEFPPLGQGEIDLKNMVDTLKDTGYKGFLSIEYEANMFGYKEDIDKVCQYSLDFMKKMS